MEVMEPLGGGVVYEFNKHFGSNFQKVLTERYCRGKLCSSQPRHDRGRTNERGGR